MEIAWRCGGPLVVEGFQFPAHHLASRSLGQVGDKPDRAGQFVGGQVRPAMVNDLSLGCGRAREEHHVCTGKLTKGFIGHRADGDHGDRGMGRDHALDLGRVEVEPAGDDQVFLRSTMK